MGEEFLKESSSLVNTVLCSLVEAPREVLPDLHPVRPWVLSCVDLGDMGQTAAIFDYRRRLTLTTYSAVSDSSSQSAVSPSSQLSTAEPLPDAQRPGGSLRIVRFYDSLVRASKGFIENQALRTEQDTHSRDTLDACGTTAVLVYDSCVVLLDYVTGGNGGQQQQQQKESYTTTEIKGFTVTALELFSRHRMLAFGCSDGSVRLWDPERREVIRSMVGGHRSSAAITRLFSLQREGTTWLVSAGSDGAVCLWNITQGGKLERSVPKAHDGGVTDLTYHALSGLLVTTGADRSVVVWDILQGGVLQEMKRTSAGKKPLACAQAFVHPQFPANSLVFFRRDAQEILVTDFECADTRELVNINNIRAEARREVKNAKVLGLTVHPTMPHLLMVNTTKGSFLLKVTIARPPDCAPIRRSVAQGKEELLMHYEVGGKAVSKYITQMSSPNDAAEVMIALKCANATMTFTRAGTFLLVQYPDIQEYQVYNTSSLMGWKIAFEGHYRGSIGVSSKQDRIAFVEAIYPQVEQTKEKHFFKKKEEKPAQPTLKFVIKDISDEGKVRNVYDADVPPRAVRRVFGGQLMGVVWTPLDGKDENCFQFFKWDSLVDTCKVGQPLPTPRAVYWDPNRPMVALQFKNNFGIYSVKLENRDQVQLVAMHRLSISSLLWDNAMLFVATDDAVKCFFLSAKDESLTIATNNSDTNAPPEETPFVPATRPTGAINLVVRSDNDLLVMDCSRQFHTIPLGGALFQFYSSAAAHNIQQALGLAERVSPRFHRHLALFLARRGHQKEVLQLSGIDDWWKLRFCTNNKLIDEALPIIQRIAKCTASKFDPSSPSATACSCTAVAEPQPVPVLSLPAVEFTVGRLIDIAVELSTLSRASNRPNGHEFLRAVLPLDTARVLVLLALHHAALGQKPEVAAVAKEASALPVVPFGLPVAAFCCACAADPAGAAAKWKSFVAATAPTPVSC